MQTTASRSNLKIVDNPLPHEKEVNLCIIRIFPVCLVVHSEQKNEKIVQKKSCLYIEVVALLLVITSKAKNQCLPIALRSKKLQKTC